MKRKKDVLQKQFQENWAKHYKKKYEAPLYRINQNEKSLELPADDDAVIIKDSKTFDQKISKLNAKIQKYEIEKDELLRKQEK